MKRFIMTICSAVLLQSTVAEAELPSAKEAAISQALSSGKPTVIDLGARTCIPCKKMAPILESLSGEYRGKASVLFIDVHDALWRHLSKHAASPTFRSGRNDAAVC